MMLADVGAAAGASPSRACFAGGSSTSAAMSTGNVILLLCRCYSLVCCKAGTSPDAQRCNFCNRLLRCALSCSSRHRLKAINNHSMIWRVEA
jgi:hypothetical protein